jgi:hypothetical protein
MAPESDFSGTFFFKIVHVLYKGRGRIWVEGVTTRLMHRTYSPTCYDQMISIARHHCWQSCHTTSTKPPGGYSGSKTPYHFAATKCATLQGPTTSRKHRDELWAQVCEIVATNQRSNLQNSVPNIANRNISVAWTTALGSIRIAQEMVQRFSVLRA